MATDPDRRMLETMMVFGQYGRTMLAVQLFEVQLGMLWLVTRDGWGKRKGGFSERNLKKATARLIHVHNAGTATAFKRELEGKIESELLDEISQAVAWRNILAHRYLRERIRNDPNRLFKKGTLAQLESLAKSYTGTTDTLLPLWQQIAKDKAKAHGASMDMPNETPPEVKAAFEEGNYPLTGGRSCGKIHLCLPLIATTRSTRRRLIPSTRSCSSCGSSRTTRRALSGCGATATPTMASTRTALSASARASSTR